MKFLDLFRKKTNEEPVNVPEDDGEELEIYYTVSVGLRQLESGTGVYDITGALEESMELAWLKVRAARLRRVICYAVETLCATGVLTALILQLRMWNQAGILR